jgi:PHP family Zn ribbon phosphoesterase
MEVKVTEIPALTIPNHPDERTGRCHKCNVRYIWPTKLARLTEMTCPTCGGPMSHTTHLFKGRTARITVAASDLIEIAEARRSNRSVNFSTEWAGSE